MRSSQQDNGQHKLRRMWAQQERAFTLIELMVVVVIITLLSATALPGASRRFASYRLRSTAEAWDSTVLTEMESRLAISL